MLCAKPQEFPGLVQELEKTSGAEFRPQYHYRKLPCEDEDLKPWYNLKSIILDVERKPDDLLFSKDLAAEVIKTLKDLYPMYEYCLKFTSGY